MRRLSNRWLIAVPMLTSFALGCGKRSAGTKVNPITAAVPDTGVRVVGLRTDAMNYHWAAQESPNWCWAASIQMVLSVWGLEASQSDIVTLIFGETSDRPGTPDQIASDLDHWTLTRAGTRHRLNATVGFQPPPLALLIKRLSGGLPVIVGCMYPGRDVGHAVVITAVIYQLTPDGPRLRSVIVRDPDPELRSEGGKRKLTAEEFGNINFYFLVEDLDAP